MTTPLLGESSIEAILQKALQPLIEEIKGLKQEIQELKQNKLSSQAKNIDLSRPIQQNQTTTKSEKRGIISIIAPTSAVVTTTASKKKIYAEIIREITPVLSEKA